MSEALPPAATPAPPVGDQRPPDPSAGDRRTARQSTLVWLAFRRHRLAVLGLVVTATIYLVALFAEFLAPYPPTEVDADYSYAPPQSLSILRTGDDGQRDFGLHVKALDVEVDPTTLEPTYTADPDEVVELGFFVKGPEYRLFGLIPLEHRLFGPKDPDQKVYLLGADRNGRDILSRIIHGARISMTIGLVGVVLAFALGVVLGGISGYVGGRVDTAIQRLIELFMSIPTLPLWLGLAAALPDDWSPMQRYFAITVILAIIAWTELARVVRGKFLSLQREDYVVAARLDGNGTSRMIGRHMLPSFTSHLVASLTLTVPAMILAETSLSFLGLGLQAPVVSWGVLLQEAQNIRTVATAPWLLFPGLAVIVAVLALNFVGDGLRDAADPYRR